MDILRIKYHHAFLLRTLHFPNLIKYLKLLKKLSTRFDEYSDLLDSEHTESNAKILKKIDYPSNYQKSIIKRNEEFAGYKYKLKLDISHCYESIYSHSITWALVGKDLAKKMYLGEIARNSLYNTGNDFDKFSSALKGNETNGIELTFLQNVFLGIVAYLKGNQNQNKNKLKM